MIQPSEKILLRNKPCRHDYYQTDTAVIVSVYIKGCKSEDVKCTITEMTLSLDVSTPSPVANLHIAPLFSGVLPSASSFQVLASKLEIKLQKADVGLHWAKLKGGEGELDPLNNPKTSCWHTEQQYPAPTRVTAISSAPAAMASTSTKSAAPRPRSKWDSFKPDEENGGVEDDAGIDDFFKKLYADADDDTRRAMMKSYQESGGTALSTNWSEVGKGKVETKPPDGMEARKW